MNYEVKLDTKAFETAIIQAAKAFGVGLPEVYEGEADLLMRGIIKKTPPGNKSQGNRRLEADIRYTAYAINERLLGIFQSQFGSGPYQGYFSINGISRPLAYAKILTSVSQLRAWHQTRRNSTTGRTVKRMSKFLNNPAKALVSKGVMAAYIREAKTHVGAAKGGWASAQLSVGKGRPLASWISSHRGRGGVLKSFSQSLTAQQTFIASNSAPWAKRKSEADSVVISELKNRARQIPVKMEKLLKLKFAGKGFRVYGSDINGGAVNS